MSTFVAAFDVGTTSLKAILVTRDGGIYHERKVALTTRVTEEGGFEQNPQEWFEAMCSVTCSWWKSGVNPSSISIIAMTGQMQDFIPIGLEKKGLCPAILYSDMRAVAEASHVNELFGKTYLREQLANSITPASILPKMLHWRTRFPRLFSRTHHCLFGAKDYLIMRLCDRLVCDPTTASTTGLFLHDTQSWYTDVLKTFDFPISLMPDIEMADSVVGSVNAFASKLTGFLEGTPITCGAGDALAATLGAGIAEMNEAYIYLGTTAWVANFVPSVPLKLPVNDAIYTLAGQDKDRDLRIAPVLNAGNIVSWALTLAGCKPGDDVTRCHELLEKSAADAGDVTPLTFVPYLNGERCPIQTNAHCGAFVGIAAGVTVGHLARAVFDGLAQSLRWCAELLDVPENRALRVVGGGARSAVWLQAIANTFDCPLIVRDRSEILPALGAASIAMRTIGWAASGAHLPPDDHGRVLVMPDAERSIAMRQQYERFKQLCEVIVGLKWPS
jgi:xylulokinase